MRTLKNFSYFILGLFFCINNLTAQVKMEFSAQFYPQDIHKIYLHTDQPIKYVPTDCELITLEIKVETNTRKNRIIDKLVENGRYNVHTTTNHTTMDIRFPNIEKIIRINQKSLEEKIYYTIYLPKDNKIGFYNVLSPVLLPNEVLAKN